MGVDCDINILRPAELNDIAECIAVLLGAEHGYYKIGSSNALFHKAKGIKFAVHPNDEHATVSGTMMISGPDRSISLFYMLERKEGIFLSARSYPLVLVIARRLVNVFGGSVVYNDCNTENSPDYCADKPPYDTMPSNSEAWDSWQQIKNDIKPITAADIDAMRPYAAYQDR